jgi:hypothetical protein
MTRRFFTPESFTTEDTENTETDRTSVSSVVNFPDCAVKGSKQ